MTTFKLRIVAPERERFNGEAVSLLLRGSEGDFQILAGHQDMFAAVGIGRCKVVLQNGEEMIGSVNGGFISVTREEVILAVTTLEYSDEIDVRRARAAKEKAERMLESAKDEKEHAKAKARLMRALSRLSAAEDKRK